MLSRGDLRINRRRTNTEVKRTVRARATWGTPMSIFPIGDMTFVGPSVL